MSNNHLYIILVMILTALLGGITNFLMSYDQKLTRNESCVKFFAAIFLSSCAVLTVPLFLQILSNNLLDVISFKNLLVFGGFCEIAAFFSKRFLEDLYSKVSKLEKKVDKNEEVTKKEIKDTTEKTETIIKKVGDIEESLEPLDDNKPTEIKKAIKENNKFLLNDEEIGKIIEQLFSAQYSFRTTAGIAQATQVAENKIIHVMEVLRELGFAENKVGSSGKDFWRILKYPIIIYSASYGVPGNMVDVTDKVKGLVSKEGTYIGIASHSFFNIPDPAPMQPKTLRIHCRIRGKERVISLGENQSFKIE